jgi:hypothetical protein
VYPGLLSAGTPFLSLPLFFIQVLVFCAVIRSALEPVEEFPPNEPAFLIVFSAGMIAALLALLLPGWGGVSSIGSAVMPGLVLGLGAILFFLVRRFHRVGSSAYRILETFTRLDWLRRSADFGFRQAAVFVSWSEAFLSGDGAMFWSLGIALLLYLVFRGG